MSNVFCITIAFYLAARVVCRLLTLTIAVMISRGKRLSVKVAKMALRYIMSKFPMVAIFFYRSWRGIYISRMSIMKRAPSTGVRYGNRVSIGVNERAYATSILPRNVSALVIVRLRVYKGIDIFMSISSYLNRLSAQTVYNESQLSRVLSTTMR